MYCVFHHISGHLPRQIWFWKILTWASVRPPRPLLGQMPNFFRKRILRAPLMKQIKWCLLSVYLQHLSHIIFKNHQQPQHPHIHIQSSYNISYMIANFRSILRSLTMWPRWCTCTSRWRTTWTRGSAPSKTSSGTITSWHQYLNTRDDQQNIRDERQSNIEEHNE